MQSIGRGWSFIKQSWIFSQKTPGVLLPSLISLLGTILTTLIMLLPLAGLIIYIRKNVWGQVAIGILIGFLLILILSVITVFSIMTSRLSKAALAGEIPSNEDAWKRLTDLDGDLYLLGLALPVYQIWSALRRLFFRPPEFSGWEEADHLLIPVLANENIKLRQATSKITTMQTDNCVFMAEEVGLKWAAFIVTVIALVVGLAAGLIIGTLILSHGQDANQSHVLAFITGSVIFVIFTLPVAAYLAYTITLFNTCLYQWGRSVREARKPDTSANVTVPEPLAIAMGIRSDV